MDVDVRVLELLASKLCHDLVSPVSAINNGVELIEDIGGSVVEESMKLIGTSAVQAARRLRLFRMAYGRAGSEENIGVKDVRQTAESFMEGGKIKLYWPEHLPSDAFTARRGALKTLVNFLILGEEVLAYGGEIIVSGPGEGDPSSCKLEILGRNARLSPVFQDALEGNVLVEDLTPRSIQSYITGKFASQFGLKLNYDQSTPDRLEVILSLIPDSPVNTMDCPES